MMDFMLALFRIINILVFSLSFISKARDIRGFQKNIVEFHLLPIWASRPFAYMVLMAELSITISMFLNGRFMSLGFLAAFLFLLLFTIAMATVLIRKINTSCNCFGERDTPISSYDIIRNIGFMICSLGGYIITTNMTDINIEIITYGLAGVVSISFVLLWLNLKSIIGIFAEQK